MLKHPIADTALTPETHVAQAKVDTKRRRPSAARQAVAASSQAASKPVASAAIPGVDAFGRVVHWNLFSTTARNERQAHQIDRANRTQASELTQQQAELEAQLARSRSEHQTSGLTRVQARRDAVEATLKARDSAWEADARAKAAKLRQQRAAEAHAQGQATSELETQGAPSEAEPHRVEGGGNAQL